MKSRAEHAVSGLIACRTRTPRRANDTSTASTMAATYDRTAEVRALDATLSGIRGLVASGVRNLHRIFRIPHDVQEPRSPQAPSQEQPSSSAANVPVIDLGGADHATVVSAVRRAYSREPTRAVKDHCKSATSTCTSRRWPSGATHSTSAWPQFRLTPATYRTASASGECSGCVSL